MKTTAVLVSAVALAVCTTLGSAIPLQSAPATVRVEEHPATVVTAIAEPDRDGDDDDDDAGDNGHPGGADAAGDRDDDEIDGKRDQDPEEADGNGDGDDRDGDHDDKDGDHDDKDDDHDDKDDDHDDKDDDHDDKDDDHDDDDHDDDTNVGEEDDKEDGSGGGFDEKDADEGDEGDDGDASADVGGGGADDGGPSGAGDEDGSDSDSGSSGDGEDGDGEDGSASGSGDDSDDGHGSGDGDGDGSSSSTTTTTTTTTVEVVEIGLAGPNADGFSKDCRMCVMIVGRAVKRKRNLRDVLAPCTKNAQRWQPACLKWYSEERLPVNRAIEPAVVCESLGMCASTERRRWMHDERRIGRANRGGPRTGSNRLVHGIAYVNARAKDAAKELRDADGPRVYREQVRFDGRPFTFKPFVSVALSALDAQPEDDVRIIATVESVSRFGFVVVLRTWGRSKVDLVGVDWFAYSKAFTARRDVWSGRARIADIIEGRTEERRVYFPAAMPTAPVVTVGLEGIDAVQSSDPSLSLEVTKVNRFGFSIRVTARGHSKVSYTMLSWIALNPKAGPPARNIQTGIAKLDPTSAAESSALRRFWYPPLGPRAHTVLVTFKRHFPVPPAIDLRLTGFTFARGKPNRVKLLAEQVRENSFIIKVLIWGDARAKDLAVSWTASPAPPRA